jgi:hypothetical protein
VAPPDPNLASSTCRARDVPGPDWVVSAWAVDMDRGQCPAAADPEATCASTFLEQVLRLVRSFVDRLLRFSGGLVDCPSRLRSSSAVNSPAAHLVRPFASSMLLAILRSLRRASRSLHLFPSGRLRNDGMFGRWRRQRRAQPAGGSGSERSMTGAGAPLLIEAPSVRDVAEDLAA